MESIFDALSKIEFTCPWVQQVQQSILQRSHHPVLIRSTPEPQQSVQLLHILGPHFVHLLPTLIIRAQFSPGIVYPKAFVPLTLGYAHQGNIALASSETEFILHGSRLADLQ